MRYVFANLIERTIVGDFAGRLFCEECFPSGPWRSRYNNARDMVYSGIGKRENCVFFLQKFFEYSQQDEKFQIKIPNPGIVP